MLCHHSSSPSITQLVFSYGESDSPREVGHLRRLGTVQSDMDGCYFHIAFDATDDLAVGSH